MSTITGVVFAGSTLQSPAALPVATRILTVTSAGVMQATVSTSDFDAAGVAAGLVASEAATRAAADAAHEADTTNIHGISNTANLVLTNDSRLSDTRTPTAHASSHAAAGSDALTLAQSQVTNLTTDLAAKAPLASPTFTGTPAAPTATAATNTTQIATTAFVTTAVSSKVGGSTGSTDNAVLRADGTGGAAVQSSLVTIDDSGSMSLLNSNTGFVINPSAWTISFQWSGSVRNVMQMGIGTGADIGMFASGTEILRMNTSGLAMTGSLPLSGIVNPKAYTFATVPSASANTGSAIRITDRSQRQAYSDGTNWRFTADDNIIS